MCWYQTNSMRGRSCSEMTGFKAWISVRGIKCKCLNLCRSSGSMKPFPLPSVWCWLPAALFQALDQVNFWKEKKKAKKQFLKKKTCHVCNKHLWSHKFSQFSLQIWRFTTLQMTTWLYCARWYSPPMKKFRFTFWKIKTWFTTIRANRKRIALGWSGMLWNCTKMDHVGFSHSN